MKMKFNVPAFFKKRPDVDISTLSFFSLYRFASRCDLFILLIGLICTTIKAANFAFVIAIYGEFSTLLVDRTSGKGKSTPTLILKCFGGGKVLNNASPEDNKAELINDSIAFLVAALVESAVVLVVGVISVDCFNQSAISQITRVRIKYFSSLMRQDIGWYDIEKSKSNFTVRLAEDIEKIQTGIAEQVTHFLYQVLGFAFSIIMSFIYGWELTLVVISYVPIIFVMTVVIAKFQVISSTKELNAYAKAANVVEEVLSGVRTVFAFGGEKIEVQRYKKHLQPAVKAAERKGLSACIGDAVTRFLYFASCALSFWFGVQWVLDDRDKEDKKYTTGTLITVFLSLISGADNMARLPPYFETFASARGAAKNIFAVIDRESEIDSTASQGKILESSKVKGDIEFKFKIIDRTPVISLPNISNKSRKPDKCNDISFQRIDFRYPTRPDLQILNGFNLQIAEGKTVALVGPSGCGKSTCIQLLQRFYDPEQDRVHIGLDEISSDITLRDLRSKLSIVSQEPTLFDRTIAENIAYGDNSRKVTMDEIIAVAQIANAHNFIVQLPQGYDTHVGNRATQLSGGQKQRIAIARALIRNPKILLMDEPTSVLDLYSEKIVQQALDSARTGRTCIVIAHRLSTIQNADIICVVQNGRIVESGAHSELMAKNGIYTQLYNAQK